jgi:hypothetical protein
MKAKLPVVSVMGTLHPFKQQIIKVKGEEVSMFVTKVFVETEMISEKYADPFLKLFKGNPVSVKIVSDVDELPELSFKCKIRGGFRQAITKSADCYTFLLSIPEAIVDLNTLAIMCAKKMASLELSLAQLDLGDAVE